MRRKNTTDSSPRLRAEDTTPIKAYSIRMYQDTLGEMVLLQRHIQGDPNSEPASIEHTLRELFNFYKATDPAFANLCTEQAIQNAVKEFEAPRRGTREEKTEKVDNTVTLPLAAAAGGRK